MSAIRESQFAWSGISPLSEIIWHYLSAIGAAWYRDIPSRTCKQAPDQYPEKEQALRAINKGQLPVQDTGSVYELYQTAQCEDDLYWRFQCRFPWK